jgi:hypothetical protein
MNKKIQILGSTLMFALGFLPGSAMACLNDSLLSLNTTERKNNIPPRLQWNANSGYCGEVVMISAGLYYGQYLSQYDARAIASPNIPQSDKRSALLLGVNALSAAKKMHLNAVEWKSYSGRSTDQFLEWVKKNVAKGYPVGIGTYINEYQFNGRTNPNAGDPEYDHIVSVYGVKSQYPLAVPRYSGQDVISFSDNGLWGGPHHHPYKFKSTFADFKATRQQANAKDGPLYSVPDNVPDYGIAIKGVIDLDGDTLPVRVATNVNYEKPSMRRGSNKRPKPMPLTLTITVSGLKPHVKYNLYRYNDVKDVPNSKFNAHAKNASQHWEIEIDSGSTYVFKQKIQSDDMVIYRAVKASAP